MKMKLSCILIFLCMLAYAHLNAAPRYQLVGGIRLVYIKGGTCDMGSMEGLGYFNERPRQKLVVKGFWMSEHEITQSTYTALMGKNPSSFVKNGNYPVETVNWHDAMEFCKKLSARHGKVFRLPYEVEWEYAARAGSSTLYYWGNEINNYFAWYNMTSDDDIHLVKSKRPNAWGLYDMSGNVAEWCLDWYSDIFVAPYGPESGIGRVVRGGSWCDDEYNLRSAFRTSYAPQNSYFSIGFRIVLEDN